MTDKELKHLSRMELIDIIYELQKQNEQNAAQIEKLQAALDEKELHIENAGSIAEAAVRISGVLEAAQAAADQYLLSIRAATADMDAKAQAAEQQRDALLADAKKQSDQIAESVRAAGAGRAEPRTDARGRGRKAGLRKVGSLRAARHGSHSGPRGITFACQKGQLTDEA